MSMNFLKILLFFVLCIEYNLLVAGGGHSRQRDEREKNELMAKNAQAILDTQVLLVPSRCDLTIPKELYDKFIADGASPNQDQQLLRDHLDQARLTGLIYPRCCLRSKSVQERTISTLGLLLQQVQDNESKAALIEK